MCRPREPPPAICFKGLLQALASGSSAAEYRCVRVRSVALEHLVQISGPFLELLFIIGITAKPGDGDTVTSRAGIGRQEHSCQSENTQPPHTAPQLRRSSHSAARSRMRPKNTIGMSHRSLVSRPVIPASE